MSSRRTATVALFLCACGAFAQLRLPGPKNEQVQTAVREFCRQDYLGGRLTADGWSRIKPLTTWKSNPAWKSFRVVSRYEQASVTTTFRSGRVDVKYLVIGRFDLGVGYAPDGEWHAAEFRLKEVDGEWRIDETDPESLEPEVSRQAALQWLQARQKAATDAGEKVSIDTALKALGPAPK